MKGKPWCEHKNADGVALCDTGHEGGNNVCICPAPPEVKDSWGNQYRPVPAFELAAKVAERKIYSSQQKT